MADDQDLDSFQNPADEGISLEDLGKAYADLVGGGATPYEEDAEEEAAGEGAVESEEVGEDEDSDDVDSFQISPRGILEGMLFVGHPENEPLTSREIASHMRGVRADEIDQWVGELNEEYDELGTAFRIQSETGGYRMVLRDELSSIRNKFYGKVREANLSQAAVDVLAVVAYQQGASRDQVEKVRGRPSGGILSQLVRRELLSIQQVKERPRNRYYTTERFLDLFGLESIDDLPKSEVTERL